MPPPENETRPVDSTILGLSTSQLAGLSADELTGNPTAIKMMLHYYRQLQDDNGRLKNDNNTLQTYVDAYETQKSNSSTGAILLAISNVSIGFGVNLLTGTPTQFWPGLSSLAIGISLVTAGVYFTFFKDKK